MFYFRSNTQTMGFLTIKLRKIVIGTDKFYIFFGTDWITKPNTTLSIFNSIINASYTINIKANTRISTANETAHLGDIILGLCCCNRFNIVFSKLLAFPIFPSIPIRLTINIVILVICCS